MKSNELRQCVPASRDAPRRETNLQFKYLKRPSTNLIPIYYCSPTISALGNQPTTKKITTANYTIDRFVNAIDRRFSCFPQLNRDYQSLFAT